MGNAAVKLSTVRELQTACLDRIEECFVIAEKHYGRKIPRVPVEFSNQMSRCAGTAQSGWAGEPKRIRLSSKLLQLNGETFINRTPGHEAAHIIANFIHGTQCKHDIRWVQAMTVIGQKAERYHNMLTPRKLDTRFLAVCLCQEHNLTARQAKNVQSLRCRSCKHNLTMKKENIMTTSTAPVVATPAVAPKAQKPKVAVKPKAQKPAAVKAVAVETVGTMDRAWAEGQMQKGLSFAKVCRAVVDSHLKSIIEEVKVPDFELLMRVCTEMEPSRNKGKVRSYLRHIITKELGLEI